MEKRKLNLTEKPDSELPVDAVLCDKPSVAGAVLRDTTKRTL